MAERWEEVLLEQVNQATAGYPFLEWNARNLSYFPHFHEEIEVVYAARGTATVVGGSGAQRLEEGEMYLLMPFEIHGVSSPPGSVTYILKLLPHRELPGVDFSSLRLEKSCFSPKDPLYQLLRSQLLSIRQEDLERREGYALAVLCHAAQLELLVLRDCLRRSVPLSQQNRQAQDVAFLRQVESFLEAHFSQRLTLDQASRACCLSRYYFAHTMKRVTGMSFVEYLTVFRLEKACRMFCQPRPNMLQIALSCGFHDQKDFCRAFKRRYAMTPTQYRKSLSEPVSTGG